MRTKIFNESTASKYFDKKIKWTQGGGLPKNQNQCDAIYVQHLIQG